MNKVQLVGRLTKDPEVRHTGGDNSMTVGKYTLAVDRKFKKEGGATADFIPCTVFGRGAEFAEKYYSKGAKVDVVGRLQTDSYKNKDGETVYTWGVIVEEQGWPDNAKKATTEETKQKTDADGFVDIPEDIGDELPFA
jgi:single-strand DNA-binding protein